MNDYYWNEYRSIMLDENLLNETLKYQQRCVEIKDKKNNPSDLNTILKLDHVKFSDTRLRTYSIEQLPEVIQKIYIEINNSYQYTQYKVSMPILTILNKVGKLESGCYSFDFKNKSLILFEKNTSKVEKIIKNVFLLAYFLNIEDAICLYGKKAYINGIKEIGYVSKKIQFFLENTPVIEIKRGTIPEQQLTNAMGINLRKCLLIEYLIFEVLY